MVCRLPLQEKGKEFLGHDTRFTSVMNQRLPPLQSEDKQTDSLPFNGAKTVTLPFKGAKNNFLPIPALTPDLSPRGRERKLEPPFSFREKGRG